ncbi:hypothetical protein HDU93_004412, partial [Gonapodya sp. JEL0774]
MSTSKPTPASSAASTTLPEKPHSRSFLNLAGFRLKKNKKKGGSSAEEDHGEKQAEEVEGTDWAAIEKAVGERKSEDGGRSTLGGEHKDLGSMEPLGEASGSSTSNSRLDIKSTPTMVSHVTPSPAPSKTVEDQSEHPPVKEQSDLASFLPRRKHTPTATIALNRSTESLASPGTPISAGSPAPQKGPIQGMTGQVPVSLFSVGRRTSRVDDVTATAHGSGAPVSLFGAGRRPSKIGEMAVPMNGNNDKVVIPKSESEEDAEASVKGMEDGLAMLETLVSLKPLAGQSAGERPKESQRVGSSLPVQSSTNIQVKSPITLTPASSPVPGMTESGRPTIARLVEDLRAVDEHATGQIDDITRRKLEETERSVGAMRDKEKAWKGSAGLLNQPPITKESGNEHKDEASHQSKGSPSAVLPALSLTTASDVLSVNVPTPAGSVSPHSPGTKAKRDALLVEAMASRGIKMQTSGTTEDNPTQKGKESMAEQTAALIEKPSPTSKSSPSHEYPKV